MLVFCVIFGCLGLEQGSKDDTPTPTKILKDDTVVCEKVYDKYGKLVWVCPEPYPPRPPSDDLTVLKRD